MLYIGEGFESSGANAAHINLYLGPKNGPISGALAGAAASPGPGHLPFLAILKPNLPAKPITLFIAKAIMQPDSTHELMTWGPAQAGVASGITKALLDGHLPAEAEDDWAAIAAVWVNPAADDAQAIYHNNKIATYEAAKRALQKGWPTRQELAEGLKSISNPFFTPETC